MMEDDLDPAFKAILAIRTDTANSDIDDSPALQQFFQETEQLKQFESNITKTIESALGVVRDSLHNNKPPKPSKPPNPKPEKLNVPSRYLQPKRPPLHHSSKPSQITKNTYSRTSQPYMEHTQGEYNSPNYAQHHIQQFQNPQYDTQQSQNSQYQISQQSQLPQYQVPPNHPHGQYAPHYYANSQPPSYPQSQSHYAQPLPQHYIPSYPNFPEAIPEEEESRDSSPLRPSPSEALKVRSDLMAMPLPLVPLGLSEEELLAQARERALLLNTHDTTTGLFGHDPVFARESRAEFYHSKKMQKQQEEEMMRNELRMKNDEAIRQRQKAENSKLERRKRLISKHQQHRQQQTDAERTRQETQNIEHSVLSRLPEELIQTLSAMDAALHKQTAVEMPHMNAWDEFLRLRNNSSKKSNKKKQKPPGGPRRSHRAPARGRVVR